MIVRSTNVASAHLAILLALFISSGSELAEASSIGSLVGGLVGPANAMTGGVAAAALDSVGSHLSPLSQIGGGAASAITGGIGGAVPGALGSLMNPLANIGSGIAGSASAMTGGAMGVPAIAASQSAALGAAASTAASSAATGSGFGSTLMGALGGGGSQASGLLGNSFNVMKDMAGGMASGIAASVSDLTTQLGINSPVTGARLAGAPTGFSFGPMGVAAAPAMAAAADATAAAAASSGAVASGMLASGAAPMMVAGAESMMAAGAESMMAAGAAPMMAAAAAPMMAAAAAAPMEFEAANAASTLAASNSVAAASDAALAATAASSSPIARADIALDAMRNAQNEAAMAGSEMVINGANNARSASMASNAYRNAKLASARDRVNIAGTIQNAARISDATIATHDAATKAEDSLLGSELAVDSAATVLDSDGAYIPPVTSSLLRSLPYGRLGLRNILPRPLAHASQNLPDVWLNGFPVRYANVPLRFYPPIMFGYGPINAAASVYNAAAGGVHFMQPFSSYNGMALNGMVFDPAYAYLSTNLEGILGTSALPILMNGQLEAQDEVAMANLLQMQQLNGVGMSTTYQGYGRLNPVPMITGSVTDANLMPTTTIGTTYPIGSALVIEPRDSFFQDYNDNASSRQNMDEREQ